MFYLVCRTDAIRSLHRGHQIDSSCFPIKVELTYEEEQGNDEEEFYEYVVKKAFDMINKGYVGMHEYLVVPLGNAKLVRFKPRQSYDVTIREYEGR